MGVSELMEAVLINQEQDTLADSYDLFEPKNFHFCMGIVSIWIILHISNKEFKRYHVQSRTQFHNSRTQFVMCQVFGKCWPVVIIQ